MSAPAGGLTDDEVIARAQELLDDLPEGPWRWGGENESDPGLRFIDEAPFLVRQLIRIAGKA